MCTCIRALTAPKMTDNEVNHSRLTARAEHTARTPTPESTQSHNADIVGAGGQFGILNLRRESYPHELSESELSEPQPFPRAEVRSPMNAWSGVGDHPALRNPSPPRPQTPIRTLLEPYVIPENRRRSRSARRRGSRRSRRPSGTLNLFL